MSFLSHVVSFLTTRANWSGTDGILVRLAMQAELAGAVVLAAGVVGMAGGFLLGRRGRAGFLAVNASNAARAVPSLALLVLLAIFPPIGLNDGGLPTAFLTLFALAIPPVLTNSYVGMRGIDSDVREAARATGMGSWRRFSRIEVPLALPLAIAGLRTAAVEVVATSTLAAYVTFNDLGSYVFAGIAQNNAVETFSGALLVALLAEGTDLVLAGCYKLVTPKALRHDRSLAAAASRGFARRRPVLARRRLVGGIGVAQGRLGTEASS